MPNPFSAIARIARGPGFRKVAPLGAAAGAGAAGAEEIEDRVEGMKDRLRAEGAYGAMDAMQQAEQQQMALDQLVESAYSAGAEDMGGYMGMGSGMETTAAAGVPQKTGNYVKVPVKTTKTGPGVHGVKTAAARAALSNLPAAFMDQADLWKYATANWEADRSPSVKLASRQVRGLKAILKKIDS